MRKFRKTFWVLGLILVLTGAGAATGPVLAPRLSGRVAVTATQALIMARPLVDTLGTPVPTIIGGSTGTYVTANQLPANARGYASLNDTATQFTVSADLVATSSYFDVVLPVGNNANNQVVAELKLSIPDGLDVDIEQSGPVNVTTSLGPIIQTAIAGKMRVGRMDANTWEATWPANTPTTESAIEQPSLINIVAYNGFVLHIALHNGTPPGFYQIQGTLTPRNI